jgi:hypothetical protein
MCERRPSLTFVKLYREMDGDVAVCGDVINGLEQPCDLLKVSSIADQTGFILSIRRWAVSV